MQLLLYANNHVPSELSSDKDIFLGISVCNMITLDIVDLESKFIQR